MISCEGDFFTNDIIERYKLAVERGISFLDITEENKILSDELDKALTDFPVEEWGPILARLQAGLQTGALTAGRTARLFYFVLTKYLEFNKNEIDFSEIQSNFPEVLTKLGIISEERLLEFYKEQQDIHEQEIVNTQNKYAEIQNIENTLATVSTVAGGVQFGELHIKKITKAYNIYYKDELMEPKMALEMFDRANLSRNIPYLQLKYDKLIYTKIYQKSVGAFGSEVINEKIISQQWKNKYEKKNYLIMTIWLGGLNANKSTSLKSYDKILIDLDNDNMEIDIPDGYDENSILAELEQVFEQYQFRYKATANIKGEFTVQNLLNFNQDVFLYYIMNDDILSKYLYMDESNDFYANKSRFDLQFQDLFNDMHQYDNKKYTTNYNTIAFILYDQEIKIKKCPNEELLEKFYCLMQILLNYYMQQPNINALEDFYHDAALAASEAAASTATGSGTGSKAATGKPATGKKKEENSSAMSLLQKLQQVAPDLFTKDYFANKVTPAFQPILITKEEYDDIVNTDDTAISGTVLAYPYPDFFQGEKYLYMKASSPKYPYLGVIINENNIEKFPYFPKGFSKDKRDTPLYKQFLARKIPNKKQKEITIDSAPIDIIKFLPREYEYNLYSDTDSNNVNSFLHCVLRAIEYDEYIKSEDKESFVQDFRANLFTFDSTTDGKIRPEILKQEMFNFTLEEIVDQVTNNEIFFDSAKFYRIIEELFNVNIYVFTTQDKEKVLEIPYFKNFYTRKYQNRYNILLYRINSEYQIIRKSGAEYPTLFDDPALFYNILCQSLKTSMIYGPKLKRIDNFGFTLDAGRVEGAANSDRIGVTTADDSTDSSSFENAFGPSIGQIIDTNGKSQIFHFQIPTALKPVESLVATSPIFTLYSYPQEPQNCPIDTNIYRIPRDLALEIIHPYVTTNVINEKNIKYTINEKQMLDGIWFDIAVNKKYYIPILENNKYSNEILEDYSPIKPLMEKTINNRTYLLKKTLHRIIQIIRWLYKVFAQSLKRMSGGGRAGSLKGVNSLKGVDAVTQFYENYMRIDEEFSLTNGDSLTYYALEARTDSLKGGSAKSGGIETRNNSLKGIGGGEARTNTSSIGSAKSGSAKRVSVKGSNALEARRSSIPRFFPAVANIDEALAYISTYMPKLISSGKIIAYNENFATKLYHMLLEYDIWSPPGIPTVIENYYLDIDDFIVHENNKIFLDINEYQKWSEKSTLENSIKLVSSLNMDILSKKDPIIYGEEFPQYIIQNTKTQTLEEALYILDEWNNTSINYGYTHNNIYSINAKNFEYKIQNLNINGKLSDIEENYYNILLLGSKYIPILRL